MGSQNKTRGYRGVETVTTEQENIWCGDFGAEYNVRNFMTLKQMDTISRNRFGISRTEINKAFTYRVDKDAPILECACNIGNQLLSLKSLGFTNLHGIDIQPDVIAAAIKRTDAALTVASVYQIPYPDNFFEMVFTSGLLIHISPENIKAAMLEIARVSGRCIWGYESYADEYTEVNYRGHDQLLWKTNFAKLYCDTVPGLRLVKEIRIQHPNCDLVDAVFLLEKTR